MAIAFGCEKCGKRYQVNDDLAGKRGKCKQCGQVFTIPVPGRATVAKPAFDPYALDSEPAVARHATPDAYAQDEILPRRAGSSLGTTRRRRKVSLSGDLESLRGWLLLAAGAFFAGTCVLSFFNFLGIVAFAGGALVLGFGLMIAGAVSGLVIACREGLGEGIKRGVLWGLAGFGVLIVCSVVLTGLRAGRAAYQRSQLKDTQALAAEALQVQPAELDRSQAYDAHVKIICALIAQTNEESDLLQTVHDIGSAQQSLPRLTELVQLSRQLHDRRQQLPPLMKSELFWLGARYNDVLSAANRRLADMMKRADSYPGAAQVLAAVFANQPRFAPIPVMGPMVAPDFPPDQSFTVVVRGVPDRATDEAIGKRLGEIQGALNRSGGGASQSSFTGQTRTSTFRPRVDVRAFAAEVDFGRVAEVGGDRIVVHFTHLPSEGSAGEAAAETPEDGSEPLPEATGAPYPASRLVDEPAIDRNATEAFHDIAPDGAVLVGVRVSYKNAFGGSKIASVQPVYRVGDRLVVGERHGKMAGPQVQAIAKPGYAVGSVRTHAGILVDGFELIFMRFDGTRLDPSDNYHSPWLGDPKGGSLRIATSGGRLAVGLAGRCRQEVNEFGLIILKP